MPKSDRRVSTLFQVADVAKNVFAVRAEVDNRITDHLSEAVISNFPAAIRFEQRHISLRQLFLVQENRRVVAAPSDSERVDVRAAAVCQAACRFLRPVRSVSGGEADS